MKVLDVVVDAQFNSISSGIVDYLVDAGHRVYIPDSAPGSVEEWRQRYTHNFAVVGEAELAECAIDFEIAFSGGESRFPFGRLVPTLHMTDEESAVTSVLSTPAGEAVLCRADCPGMPDSGGKASLDRLRDTVRDNCIDALILLSRQGWAELDFEQPRQCTDDLAELMRLEEAAEVLADRAHAADARGDGFRVTDLLASGPRPLGAAHVLEYPLGQDRLLSESQAELLCLYLQMLLNARKAGTYSYDLETPDGQIRKHIELSRSQRRPDIDRQLGDPVHEVWNNKFYAFGIVFDEASDPGVRIHYGVPEQHDAEACLTLNVPEHRGTLLIEASGRLPFFSCLREHLDVFFARLAAFEAGDSVLDDLLALPEQVYRHYYDELNRTVQPYRDDQPIHRLFEEQAVLRPDATALVHEDHTLSYRELNEAANRFARLLRDRHGLERGDLVALYLDRDANLFVALLAVLKLGGAYIPLDLNSPARRTAGILADSRPKLVISDEARHEAFHAMDTPVPVLRIDAAAVDEAMAAQSADNPAVGSASDDLAYVIYTSGTTGRPKGVAVEHKSYVNIASDIGRCIGFRPGERMLAVTTVAFDISTLELFMPLIHGGTVVLAGRADLLDVTKLVFLIEQVGVSVVQATPSLWHLITQNLDGKRLPIRALCGGEALSPQLATVLAESVDTYWNVYGPTETTVWSTRHQPSPDDSRPLIGRPVANTQCYVLDEERRPLPPGVVGELYIGGAGLARGYLNAPELTADRFVPVPQSLAETSRAAGPEARLYRTGDLARCLPCGNLEFAGRNDFQVKLRGHRIELGEIESGFKAHPAITNSLVVVHRPTPSPGDEANFLIGYYLAEEPVPPTELTEHLAALVPGYMVPAVLIHLESMPLNANGKVDRSALPDPTQFLTGGYLAPTTDLEARLCEIWDQVLGNTAKGGRSIGVTDDFFNFGGNSILGIKLVNKINSELSSDIKIRDIFREKTIQRLAPLVAASLGDFAYGDFVLDGTDTDRLHEPFPLTNVQQTYYLGRFNNFELSNVSTHVYSEFRYSRIDHDRLEAAYNRLIERHLALRTVFTDGQQRFLREVPPYRIVFHELQDRAELDQLRDTYSHKLYDPEQYPLFDIVLSRLDGDFRLHISFDALIVDMGSFQILFDEWAQLYTDPESCLPDLGVSYRDYVLQYEKVRESPLLLQAEQYWQGKADDYHLDLRLPLRARPSDVGTPVFRRRTEVIPAAVWDELSAKCARHGISPTALVVELFSRVLSRWSGQDRLCMNLTLFNRLPLHPDINGVIGDFTVLELFDYRAERELGIAAKLRRVHSDLLQDVDNNLFDGVDFQRLLKTRHSMPVSKVVAPVVLTSTLGAKGNASMFEMPLEDAYQGVDHSISQTPQVWLDNKAYETEEGFVAEWDYVEQLFDPAVIDAMHDGYCRLMEGLAELDWETSPFPALPVPAGDLALIDAANAHDRPSGEHTLFSLYESRLGEDGRRDSIAVIDEALNTSHTYGQLHRDSVRLAEALLAPGVMSEQRDTVAVLTEKGYLQTVATLAVMKAGSAYVPMNVEWPAARIGEVLESAGTHTLLVSREQFARLEVPALGPACRVLVAEELLETGAPGGAVGLPEVGADDVAYVIFTSGSTGRPKGVAISHRGAVNTLLAVNERFGVTGSDRVLALSELSFDLSVYDLFGVLAEGGAIVFPVQTEVKNPAHWVDLVERHGVTVWNSVPQLAGLLVDEAGESGGRLASLRVLLLSGDWIPTGLPDRVRALVPHAVVMSLGGATEGSIWSIWFEIGRVDPAWGSVPYGVAMPNQRMYVLSGEGEHAPVGVIGEIHIGGMGVALEYWRDEVLTAERFVEHPELGRLYRTGDLGRWSSGGYIEFIGRDDFQVKLNGYRVELEEIAAKLTRLPGVDGAVARIQQGDPHDQLVGYLVPAADYRPLTGNGDPALDKQAFLLSGHGVLDGAAPGGRPAPPGDPAVHARAKSYRHFLDEHVDPSFLRKRFAEVLEAVAGRPEAGQIPAPAPAPIPADWTTVLETLTAVSLPDRPLPKYRYPSAGSSYPVRTFVTLSGPADSGSFYHHPLTGELRSHGLGPIAEPSGTVGDELHLVVFWPAITPLYGEDARRLALLEAGHMLALLTDALDARHVPYEVVPEERRLDDDHTVVCRIVPGGTGGFRPSPLDLACFPRDADADEYTEHGGDRRHAPGDLPVLDRVSDVYAILRRARCLLTLEGEATAGAELTAGFLFQRLSELLRADGMGTCPLGLRVTDRGIYTMAVGMVDERAHEAPDSPADPLTLHEAVTEELSRVLPDYMLPTGYGVLDALPLGANGKLAADRLPPVEFAGAYVEPATETERALAGAWAEVLDRPVATIGAGDSFLAAGGNSLAAMKLVRLLQRNLGFELKLRDLYRNDTILKLAEHLGTARADAGREEGEL